MRDYDRMSEHDRDRSKATDMERIADALERIATALEADRVTSGPGSLRSTTEVLFRV